MSEVSRASQTAQPLDAVNIPGALLKVSTYCKLHGVSASTTWRRIRSGELEVVRHGARCTRITAESARRFAESGQ